MNKKSIMDNSRFKITSASDTSIGFDYQFYFYFYLLLDLRHSEKIGIEIKDDIHIDLANGKLILIQAKHTIQKGSSGNQINLTERDIDLWKTIGNWINVIKNETDQDKFIGNTTFQLISNKSIFKNQFIIQVIKLNNNETSVSDFKTYLQNLHSTTTDETIKGYVLSLKKIKKATLKSFISSLKFDLNEDDLIIRIKQRLLEKIHIAEKVDDVYNNLFSELKSKEYLDIKAGKKTSISFEEFNKSFKSCFKVGLSTNLPIRNLKFIMPTKYENQLFILQLLDIGDINPSDKDEMIEYTTQMLQLHNNLKKWEEDGDLMSYELDKFNRETLAIWKNSFRSKFRVIKDQIEKGAGADDAEIKYKALECLDEMRKAILKIDETCLTTELSNGHFYLLTEQNNIGWHYEWKSRY